MYNFIYKIRNILKFKFYNNRKNKRDLQITDKDYISPLDYCTICDYLSFNKYFIYHCDNCNSCHIKNKLFCLKCRQCYNPNLDNDIIKHRKICINYNN